MSVQRVSDDHRNFADRVGRTVVVPSDVSLLYKTGSCFGGRVTESSKWVPIQHEGELLTLDVFVTTTKPITASVRPIVERIAEISARDPYLNARPPASRQPRRIPGQAPRRQDQSTASDRSPHPDQYDRE
jgi:hypothetical protein